MKTLNLLRSSASLQSIFSGSHSNVQEIDPVNPVAIATSSAVGNDARPRVLTQRNARQARRFAH